jgi:hypothetical protein
MRVNVIIAGFQKCGTTALHSFLSHHPKVIASSPKEIDFFNYTDKFEKGIKYYHSYFKQKPFLANIRNYTFIEASPSYVAGVNAELTAERILSYNPEMKIIALVRNPIQRAFSAWNMYRKRYLEGKSEWWVNWMLDKGIEIKDLVRREKDEFDSFLLFIEKEIECLSKNQIIECPVLENGNYYRGVELFQNKFKNNFHVISNESLNADTENELKNVAHFLNLETFNWAKFDNTKIFKGPYKEEVSKQAQELLSEYYSEANIKLNKLTGIKY